MACLNLLDDPAVLVPPTSTARLQPLLGGGEGDMWKKIAIGSTSTIDDAGCGLLN